MASTLMRPTIGLSQTIANVSVTAPLSIHSNVTSDRTLVALLTVLVALSVYWLVFASPRSLHPRDSKIRPITSAIPFIGSIGFYKDRVGFLRKHFGNPEAEGFHGGVRRITVYDASIVLLAGTKQDAKTFFCSRTLKFTPAYHRLLSGVPAGVTPTAISTQDEWDSVFKDNLKKAIRPERLAKLVPQMLEDVRRSAHALPEWKEGTGMINPKDFSFPLIFGMSMRSVGLAELADQPEVMAELLRHYWAMEKSSSYWSIFFATVPFPSSCMKAYNAVGASQESRLDSQDDESLMTDDLTAITLYNTIPQIKLYTILLKAAKQRLQEARVEDDTFSMLLERGLDIHQALRFVMTGLFAAVFNSTTVAMWLLIYLGAHPEFRKRAATEVFDRLNSIADRQGIDWNSKSRVEQLQALSLEEWENGFDLVEAALRETMRLVMEGTFFRLNVGASKGSEPQVHGENVKNGEFLGYWLGSTHRNAKIYSSPNRWDPERWARGEGSGELEFLGWGVGMHPCTGIRFAKLEMKCFAVTFLVLMDWDSIDPRTGENFSLDTLPVPQLNGSERMPLRPVSFRFTSY
ncbi:hypothetical protein OC834_004606 [Tilletia horrida]|nr:hypothetical protein OC834_004606 [Tilletia horrida]